MNPNKTAYTNASTKEVKEDKHVYFLSYVNILNFLSCRVINDEGLKM